jgi:hypothetical protein
LILLPAFAGCAKLAHVSGRAVEDGKPYVATAEGVELIFSRTDGETSMKVAVSIKKDGTFVVYGPNNEGLPPGKYKIGQHSDIEGGRKRLKDIAPESSTMELDLKAGDRADITVDLVKHTLTRN